MAQARAITGLISDAQRRPGVELMARRRSVSVNATTHIATDFAFQSNATRRGIVGALHAHQFGRQRQCHLNRHAGSACGPGQFGRMKIDAVTSAAGATAFADRAG